MEEDKLNQIIEELAVITLGRLKDICEKEGCDDRQASLVIHYFMSRFVKNGWKGVKPSQVFDDASRIIKEIGQDTPIPMTSSKDESRK